MGCLWNQRRKWAAYLSSLRSHGCPCYSIFFFSFIQKFLFFRALSDFVFLRVFILELVSSQVASFMRKPMCQLQAVGSTLLLVVSKGWVSGWGVHQPCETCGPDVPCERQRLLCRRDTASFPLVNSVSGKLEISILFPSIFFQLHSHYFY